MADTEDFTVAEEYKLWKKNTPYLYDTVITHALEWPSLTIEWLPEQIPEADKNYISQRLVLGTNTSGAEQDHLCIVEVRLPNRQAELELTEYEVNHGEVGGYGVAQCSVRIIQQIPHPDEVNRARCNPHNPHIIATKDPNGMVNIFDYTRHKTRPKQGDVPKPDIVLTGHSSEGYGLSWAKTQENLIVSGSYDDRVCLWDISSGYSTFAPTWSMDKIHHDHIEEVTFHPRTHNIVSSAGDDGSVVLFDLRTRVIANRCNAHEGPCNSVDWSPFRDSLFVTGGGDNECKIWDSRRIHKPLHTFSAHTSEVFSVKFAPHSEHIFGSSSLDRRIATWDLSKIGDSQTAEEAEDGPPELLFLHGGHTSRVNDFDWSSAENWLVASVADDNILQVWQMASAIHKTMTPEEVTDEMVQ
ncbi:hypothetical protein RCL1_004068 [Eukaryota sp. TZLM3-RCL]